MKFNVVKDFVGSVPQDASTVVDGIEELLSDKKWDSYSAVPIEFNNETKGLLGQTVKKYLRQRGFDVTKVKNQPVLLIHRPPEDFVPEAEEDEDDE